jgi:hypothetical protein
MGKDWGMIRKNEVEEIPVSMMVCVSTSKQIATFTMLREFAENSGLGVVQAIVEVV